MGQHKCENCGAEIRWKTLKEKGNRAVGWSGNGKRSKYGKQFDRRSGYAWWCPKPECQRQAELSCLRLAFKGYSEVQIRALYEQVELDRLRQN